MNFISLFSSFNYTGIAILSSFFGAIATILARTLLKDIKARDIMGINFLVMGAALVLIAPIFYHFDASFLSMGLVILIAIIDTAANYFFFKTFEKTEASVAAPLLSLAPGFTFLSSWAFLQEKVSPLTYVIATGILVSIIIFTYDFKQGHQFKLDTLKPAILSSILFGLSAIPSKYLLSNLHAINAPTLYMMRAGFIALFSLLFFNFSINQLTQRQFRIIFVRGLVVIAQWILLYLAITKGSTGVSVTLANITPIFVFILGMIFLKEKMSLKKFTAAGLILLLSFLI